MIPLLLALPALASPVISEVVALNADGFFDEVGEHDDWIEIANPGLDPVELGGLYLTDDLAFPGRALPSLLLGPGEHLVLWADGDLEQGELHLGFRVSGGGETLWLLDADGAAVLDRLDLGPQHPDVAAGPDGEGGWTWFAAPTPGQPNAPAVDEITRPPAATHPGGPVAPGLEVDLVPDHPDDVLRYTLDGRPPEEADPAWDAALRVDDTTVLRARAFREGAAPGAVLTRSFLVGESGGLAVVSVVTDPDHLWGTNGLYVHLATRPERAASVEVFEPDGTSFSTDAGVSVSGNLSATFPKKSLRLRARSSYGADRLEHPFFPDLDIPAYRSVTLRNAGNDWLRAHLRDALAHRIGAGAGLDVQAWRPAHVWQNGTYWGLFNLREHYSGAYFEDHHGVERVDLLESIGDQVEADVGSAEGFLAAMDTLEAVPGDESLAAAEALIEVDSLVDYAAVEIFAGNLGWPGTNNRFWAPADTEGQWRWVLSDLDASLSLLSGADLPSEALAEAAEVPYVLPLPLGRLLRDPAFRDRFAVRFADLLNGPLHPDITVPLLDEMVAVLEPEMPREAERWWDEQDLAEWYVQLDRIYGFLEVRPDVVRDQLAEVLGLGDLVTLVVDAEGEGRVRVNTMVLPALPWSAVLFEDLPVELEALPDPGWVFAGWEPEDLGEEPVVDWTPGDGPVRAVFVPEGGCGCASSGPAGRALLLPLLVLVALRRSSPRYFVATLPPA